MKIIQKPDGEAEIYTPYNKDFVSAIKRLGGASWDRDLRCWTVPVSKVDAVREIMRSVYGEDDTPKPPSDFFDREALEAERQYLEDRMAEVNGILIMLDFGPGLDYTTKHDAEDD